MDKQQTKLILVTFIITSTLLGGVAAYTFYTRTVPSNVKVVANGYSVTLYTDESFTTEFTEFQFTDIMEGIDSYSDWVDVWVVFDDNPETQVWGHITTEGLPEGLTLYGETYRFSTDTFQSIDVDDLTCDFGNDPLDDSYTPHLRFRVERTTTAIGSYDFTTIFTIMDTSTI